MAGPEPPKPRSEITETPDELRIVIRAKKNISLLSLMTFGFIVWCPALIGLVVLLFVDHGEGVTLCHKLCFLAVWLALAMPFTAVALRMCHGREIILVREGSLIRRLKVPLLRNSARECRLEKTSNLRYVPRRTDGLPVGRLFRNALGLGPSCIALDCDGRPLLFGLALDEQEAGPVIEAIRRRL